MTPNATDMFVIPKPRRAWPDPALPKEKLVQRLTTDLARFPGNSYDVTRPIQMRFNERIAGVRGDIAVKVFGDDVAAMNRTAAQVADVLRRTSGAVDVKIEYTGELPVLDVSVNRDAMARIGLTAQDMQDSITAAIGGWTAGMIFEGDRRFSVVIRLTEAQRADLGHVGRIPLPVSGGAFVPLASVADVRVADGPNQISREKGKRRVVIQTNVRGGDVGSVGAEARGAINTSVLTRRQLPGMGRSGREFAIRRRAAEPRRAGMPRPRPAVAVRCARQRPGGCAGVHRHAVRLCRRGVATVRARHGPLDLRGGGLHRAVRHCGAQRAGDGARNPAIDAGGHAARGRSPRRGAATAATRGADGAGGGLGFVPMALGRGAGAEVQRPLATVVIGGWNPPRC
jgi:cobalt-zinc-cadmium resistance protein CzcA